MDEVVIVGHGHSMTNSGLGSIIDSYPVVRMKQSRKLIENHPEDYGTRVDYAGGTTAVLRQVVELYPDAKEYWGYIKGKSPDKPDKRDNIKQGAYQINGKIRPVFVPSDLHFYWLARYYSIRGNDELRFSTGMGLLLIALSRLKPKTLYLAGYDSILDPETNWSSTLATKKYDWKNDPPHDFAAEHLLLKEIDKEYATRIECITESPAYRGKTVSSHCDRERLTG